VKPPWPVVELVPPDPEVVLVLVKLAPPDAWPPPVPWLPPEPCPVVVPPPGTVVPVEVAGTSSSPVVQADVISQAEVIVRRVAARPVIVVVFMVPP
jgi:hypothetical protein